jgi:zinc transport system substrate-binding protein
MKSMPRALSFAAIAVALAIATLAFSGCGSDDASSPTPATARLDILTTIYPLTYFTERIGGDRVTVTSIISPGVEAHDFEPTPGDIRRISEADVLIYNHPAFETWIEDAIGTAGNGALVIVKAADLPDDLEFADDRGAEEEEEPGGNAHEDGETDPHVWLNPVEAAAQARAIETALAQADPEGAALFKANADALAAELMDVDQQYADALASCQLDEIVVSHLAYGHLAERYGLHELGLSGLSPEFESGPQQIAAIVDEMRALGISYILQEPIADDRLAETVAAETRATILPLHPLESLTQGETDAGETFFTIMAKNLESLKTALGCE